MSVADPINLLISLTPITDDFHFENVFVELSEFFGVVGYYSEVTDLSHWCLLIQKERSIRHSVV
jgi:hypothetical protein